MNLEPLEPRDTPAGLYDPATYDGQPAFPDAPGVTAREMFGDVDGNGTVDRIELAGPGGGPRVAIYSGGDGSGVLVYPSGPGGPALNRGTGDLTVSTFVYEPTYVGGLDGNVIHSGDGSPDTIVLYPLAGGGGGSVLKFYQWDQPAGELHQTASVLAFGDINFRGGVTSVVTSPGAGVKFGVEIAVIAGPGGSPRVEIYTPAGVRTANFLVGPDDFRQPDSIAGSYQFVPSASAVQVAPGVSDEWGIGVRLPDGSIRVATRDGVVHPYPTFF